MNEILVSIKEVQEGGKHLANHYLSKGYILLDIQQGARHQKFPEGNSIDGRQYYVRRNPVYIVGRPAAVEPADPPARWEPENKNDAE